MNQVFQCTNPHCKSVFPVEHTLPGHVCPLCTGEMTDISGSKLARDFTEIVRPVIVENSMNGKVIRTLKGVQ